MKHIEVQYHNIIELITEKRLKIRKIDTMMNITDSLTKVLPEDRFQNPNRTHGATTELTTESKSKL